MLELGGGGVARKVFPVAFVHSQPAPIPLFSYNIHIRMLCYVMLCYVMLCYIMLCYVRIGYVMLGYVRLG